MLRHHAKVGAFVVVSMILAAEAYLLYEHYDRYQSGSTTPGLAASGVTVLKEATRRDLGGLDVGGGPDTFEDATSQTTSDAGNAGPGTPGSGESFVHRASDDNSRGDYTYLTHPSIDGDPDALVLVAPYPNGGDAVSQSSGGFVHRAETSNTQGHTSFLDDPLTNQKPDAVVSVAQTWNPRGEPGGIQRPPPKRPLRRRGGVGDPHQRWRTHTRRGRLQRCCLGGRRIRKVAKVANRREEANVKGSTISLRAFWGT